MIFVTVGTQLPFERLVKAADAWAERHPGIPMFAQVGDTEYTPQHMDFAKKLTPKEYAVKFNEAQVVVSHAGMGTIISGLENAKLLVLMPRLAAFGEHRNDHQVGTAEHFARYEQLRIVTSQEALHRELTLCMNIAMGSTNICPPASIGLIEKLKTFVNEV